MSNQQSAPKKIHPQKFALWIGITSIIMMFGGLTSGYIVKRGQGAGWIQFDIPASFWWSTIAIIASSITLILAKRTFKRREIPQHKTWVLTTFILGIAFAILQYIGFKELSEQMKWDGNIAFQYLSVIVLVHVLHVVGGIVALLILFLKTFRKRVRTYSADSITMVATYWHFVDILWIYLLIFFLLNR